jgi:WW domain-containing oxidoreductase
MLSQLHIASVLPQTLKATTEETSKPSRVVLMSSEVHRFSPSSTSFASIEEINTDIGATELYAHSRQKVNSALLSSPSHRFVIVNATHPGGVKTPQQDQ